MRTHHINMKRLANFQKVEPIISIPIERIGISGGGSSSSPLSSGIVDTTGADAIVVFVRRNPTYPITSVTDTYGNTYSLAYNASSSNVFGFIYVATGITTGVSNNVTVVAGGGSSPGFKVIQIALKNVDQVSPIYGGIHSADSGSVSQNITSNSINDVILSSGYSDSGLSTFGIGQTEIINETSASRQMKITEEYTLGLDTQSFDNEQSYLPIYMVSIVVKAA